MARLKMHENSLFAVLLRSPWWISVLVSAGVFGVIRIFVPWGYALAATGPFIAIAAIATWKQLRAPGAASVARALERLRAMSWEEFSAALEAAYRREGYTVSRLEGEPADLEIAREARRTLVACKRWKATQTGIEPLRELHAARRRREAHECIFVATGEVSGQALAFAREKGVRVLQGADLAKLLS